MFCQGIAQVSRQTTIDASFEQYRNNTKKNWTNPVETKVVYLEQVGLEDAIEFQDIDFEIIYGYYDDE